MDQIPLIHPIYLDVPMLVSFAAATQGGLSLESEVTSEAGEDRSTSASIAGKLGFSQLFQSLFDASLSTELSGERSVETRELRKESRAHTEASIAILLYHQLEKSGGYLLKPENLQGFAESGPGTLVEVAGSVEKNAVDAVIDYMDAVSILSRLDTTKSTKGSKSNKQAPKTELEQMRDLLDSDRKRTPISNIIVRCSKPSGLNVVVTLRTENLRDLTLSELDRNTVRVVGKITRVVGEGESMSSFENYGMALMDPTLLNQIFEQITSNENIVTKFSDIEVKGPSFQILPLMIFV